MTVRNMLIAVLFLSGMAMADNPDEMKTETYHFSTYQIEHLDAYFSFGLGDFNIKPNSDSKSIDAAVTYHPEKTIPDIRYSHNENTGVLKVDMDSFDEDYREDEDRYKIDLNLKGKFKDYNNILNFQLPTSVVTDLKLDFGLGSANLDLSDIQLSHVDIDCGLSDVFIEVNKLNPVVCSQVKLSAGLGDLDVRQLGNLNAKNMDIEVGLGSATIDLRGQSSRDTEIDIEIGLGDMDVTLPEDANIKIRVNHSFLSSVKIRDLVKKDENTWVSPDWKAGHQTIIMNVDIGLGSIDIDLRD